MYLLIPTLFVTEDVHQSLFESPPIYCASVNTSVFGEPLCHADFVQIGYNYQKHLLELAASNLNLSYLNVMLGQDPDSALRGAPGELECSDSNDITSCQFKTDTVSISLCSTGDVATCEWKEKYGVYFLQPLFNAAARQQMIDTAVNKANNLPAYYFDVNGYQKSWSDNMK